MAQIVLAPGKKRYSLSLTEANVERFQRLAKEFKLPPNQMSLHCDEIILQMANLYQTAKDQGKFTLKDLFTMMGEQMELHLDDEGRKKDEFKKRKKEKTE